jgi:tRNA(fMet)-specific endonuclease VapC
MTFTDRGPVVVDTGVFGARLVPRGRLLASGYGPLLEGRPAVIAFVTVAELRFGARHAGWGPARLQRLEGQLAYAEIVWPDSALIEAYVVLRSWCVEAGHGLGQKDHEADRWIAATALYLGVPLVTHDAIFSNVEGVSVITRL